MNQKREQELQRKLEAMKMVELRAIAEGANIPVSGNKKAELITKIVETIKAGGLWIPGMDETGAGSIGPGIPAASAAHADGQYSVKLRRIMEARQAGSES